MVGETAVRIQKLAAGNIRPERLEHRAGIKAARSIAGRPPRYESPPAASPHLSYSIHDQTAQAGGVSCHIRGFFHRAGRFFLKSGGTAAILGIGQDFPDVGAFQPT